MKTVEMAVFLLLSPAVVNVTNQKAIHSNILSGAAACYFPDKKISLRFELSEDWLKDIAGHFLSPVLKNGY
jgi:hypothetical protein